MSTAMLLFATGCGTLTSQAAGSPKPKPHPVSPSPTVRRWNSPPPLTINRRDQYEAVVHTTAGTFVIDLFAQQDPVAVNNFVFLAKQHFYDQDQFFRVLKSFVIQTGDPLNNGTGGPGYTWKGELPVPFPYQPGIVAMAVSNNNPNTNGSQFFICTGPQSEELNQDPIYTEVGRVVGGWSTIEKIADGAVTVNPLTGEDSKPLHPYVITSITIQTHPAPAAPAAG
ncbi:MAG: peptidylprolyl isomerase [Firmicutes bacterium]|jgi:cyclophilin family peptidyl-prolyl cis-trans isomerase|nr:peptidylprolyl isomerase [Bacillota bacterium]